MAEDRKTLSLAGYFTALDAAQGAGIAAIAMDMGEPYRQTVRAHVPNTDLVSELTPQTGLRIKSKGSPN